MNQVQTVVKAGPSVARSGWRMRKLGVVLAVSVFGLAASNTAAAVLEPCGPEGAYPDICVGGDPLIYPIATTTTTTVQAQVPPPVTLPKTGSSNVGDSVMIGATIALSGVGLVIVTRRRRRELDPA